MGPPAQPQTAAQRTLDPLRVAERGQPVAPRQSPEACSQALRGLRRGAVAVFTDQDLTPVWPHARGAWLLGHDRSPSLDGLAGAVWHGAPGVVHHALHMGIVKAPVCNSRVVRRWALLSQCLRATNCYKWSDRSMALCEIGHHRDASW